MVAHSIVHHDRWNAALCERIDAFVTQRGGSIFQTSHWLKAIRSGTGHEAHGLVAYWGREIIGWLPLHCVHSPIFGRALVSSGFAVGGGVLSEDPAIARALCRAATELAQRKGAATIELRGGDAPDGWRIDDSSAAGFEAALAADDESQLLAIPRKARAEVRKGLRNDLTVAHGRDDAMRRDHYAVYARSVHALGTPVFPRSLFEAVLEAFPTAEITTVSDAHGPVSSVLSLYHGGAVMPYWGGGLAKARDLHANERMYYELMLHARQKGAVRFDFGRSKAGSGPYRFKKNWGFHPQPLRYSSWAAPGMPTRNVNAADPVYAKRVEAWKRLPPFLADRLGPLIARGLG